MFGHNEIVGRRFFRDSPEAAAGKLLVTSVFRTIQGEGPFAGEPAVFVRLAKCNLACSFCDTYFDSGDWMSPDELRAAVGRTFAARPAPDLMVVTGGEPTLQGEALARAVGILPRMQVESNGILPATDLPPVVTVVVSPKCGEKGGVPTRYLEPSPASLARASCLKFVLSGARASPYYSVPDWALRWRADTGRQVFVSPMAEYMQTPADTRRMYEARRDPDMSARVSAERISFWEPGLLDMERCRRNYEHAAAYALDNALRLTVQMQLFASLP